ncbi:hypothetical protein [Paracoccus marcusii]|jgi:hypothetical protein|uniref:hypothetical protein n=1 Tax=Paracoccus marcusii TaxID=59779 RepID=UPI0024914BBF|nr:hypothetical protein [Paracoccus marcusii]|tara:strand:- start:581 stop:766 length:186 start_codon:yes stop_codon:yes gene_type:complete
MNSRILVGFRATEDTPKKPEQGNRKNSAQQRPRSGHSVILQHLSKWGSVLPTAAGTMKAWS